MLKKFLANAALRCRANTGPKWAWNLSAIFSPGDFPFRLQEIATPFSVPTIKRVGMLGSYSRHVAPIAFSIIWPGALSIRVSNGSFNFLVSHLKNVWTMKRIFGESNNAQILPFYLSVRWATEKFSSRFGVDPQNVADWISVTYFE